MYDGLNKGAKMAHGELVGQINTDDWYEPDAVKWMVRLYRKTGYDVAWGSIRIKKANGDMIKHAKIGRLWTTAHWCHPGMFSKRTVLQSHPYPLESMYDDFDYITRCHVEGLKLVTTDKIISNFTFGNGGQSTKHSLSEVKRRIDTTYGIYKKYGMSRGYCMYRVVYELAKYFWGGVTEECKYRVLSGNLKTTERNQDGFDFEQIGILAKVGLAFLTIACATFPFAMAWLEHFNYQAFPTRYNAGYSSILIGAFAFFYFILANGYTKVWLLINSIKDIIYSQITAAIVSDLIFFIVVALLIRRLPDVAIMLVTFATQILLITVSSLCAEMYFSPKHQEN